MIALDMDGTTLTHDLKISNENKLWIRKARDAGIQVTFATGRHLSGLLREYIRELDITAPVVTLNGGEVWTPDERLLSRTALDLEDVVWMHQLAKESGVHFWAGTTTGPLQDTEFPFPVEDQTWLKFGYFTEDASVVQEIWRTLEAADRFELTNSHPLNIEVNARGVTKAAGLQTVCDYLHLDASQVAVMGDSLNDVPMIQWAGLGIAMGNAQDVVKAAADFVTESNEENGVARAIERILNGEL